LRALDIFDEGDVARFLGGNRILHVYGRLRTTSVVDGFAPLDLTPVEASLQANAKYAGDPDILEKRKLFLDQVYEASQGLRTIDPDDKALDEHVLNAAREAIGEATCVYILGYGFDRLNSERLGLRESLRLDKASSHCSVLFTNLGDSNRINKLASTLFFGRPDQLLAMERPYIGDLQGRFYCEKSTRNVYDALALDFDALEERFTAGSAI
jgi:hypothetical protein